MVFLIWFNYKILILLGLGFLYIFWTMHWTVRLLKTHVNKFIRDKKAEPFTVKEICEFLEKSGVSKWKIYPWSIEYALIMRFEAGNLKKQHHKTNSDILELIFSNP